MKSKLILVGAALIAFLGAVFVGALFYLSDLLLFPFKEREKWTSVETIDCTKWMREYAFADLRNGAPSDKPLDMSCDESLNLPGQSFYTRSTLGDRIHYKVYDNLTEAQRKSPVLPPLFFHVHGVSGTHMHGARYFKMAARLGFQLVAMDLSNHGLSDHNGRGASYGCREQHDVVSVLEALKAQFPGRKILLHGTSMGSMAALNAGAQVFPAEANEGDKTVLALALENPIPSVKELVLSTPKKPNVPQGFITLGVWLAEKRAGVNFSACEPVQAATKVTVPTYVYNSTNDDIVAPEVSKQIVDAIPGGKMFRVKVFNRGAHSTVWNGNPEEVEQDFAALWMQAVPTVATSPTASNPTPLPVEGQRDVKAQ
ncbi:MAG: alpha/beta hydrolase [Silvanigrellaceae bacterium]